MQVSPKKTRSQRGAIRFDVPPILQEPISRMRSPSRTKRGAMKFDAPPWEDEVEVKKKSKRIVSIIVTHQNRLKCFLNSLMGVKYRFGNCSIIQLSMYKPSVQPSGQKNSFIHVNVSLIFDGFTKPNKKYYTTEPNPKDKNLFPFVNLDGNLQNFMDIDPSKMLPNTEYIFFLVRHGNAVHNEYNLFTKYKSLYNMDTLLTENGEGQAEEAGRFLKKYLDENHLNVNYIFSSDLKRTRQTLTIIVDQLKPLKNNEIIVLPCAHELTYFDDKNCDKRMINYSKGALAGENLMRCDVECKLDDKSISDCCRVTYGKTKLDVNWVFYKKFYDGLKRQDIYYEDVPASCAYSNMIKNAIDILDISRTI
jgi:broad specificity phosphatase PhoE